MYVLPLIVWRLFPLWEADPFSHEQTSYMSKEVVQGPGYIDQAILGSFRNVKTLHVHRGLVGELSRSPRLDGEPPLEVLPELNELVCPKGSGQAFTPFIHEREVAGRPVNLTEQGFPVSRYTYTFLSSTGVFHISSG